ncbi:MAG TPA: hypothetical protein DC047_08870 [Blastocatellia bacterium]|nr:hypothetical protein [Blastocatellia bacterium]
MKRLLVAANGTCDRGKSFSKPIRKDSQQITEADGSGGRQRQPAAADGRRRSAAAVGSSRRQEQTAERTAEQTAGAVGRSRRQEQSAGAGGRAAGRRRPAGGSRQWQSAAGGSQVQGKVLLSARAAGLSC